MKMLGFLRRIRRGTSSTETVGRKGERLAARRLRRAGYRILERNLRIGRDEADIVALDPDRTTIVIVDATFKEDMAQNYGYDDIVDPMMHSKSIQTGMSDTVSIDIMPSASGVSHPCTFA